MAGPAISDGPDAGLADALRRAHGTLVLSASNAKRAAAAAKRQLKEDKAAIERLEKECASRGIALDTTKIGGSRSDGGNANEDG